MEFSLKKECQQFAYDSYLNGKSESFISNFIANKGLKQFEIKTILDDAKHRLYQNFNVEFVNFGLKKQDALPIILSDLDSVVIDQILVLASNDLAKNRISDIKAMLQNNIPKDEIIETCSNKLVSKEFVAQYIAKLEKRSDFQTVSEIRKKEKSMSSFTLGLIFLIIVKVIHIFVKIGMRQPLTFHVVLLVILSLTFIFVLAKAQQLRKKLPTKK